MSYQTRKDAAAFIQEAADKIEQIMDDANRFIMDVLTDLETKAEELYEQIENAEKEIAQQSNEIEELERELNNRE